MSWVEGKGNRILMGLAGSEKRGNKRTFDRVSWVEGNWDEQGIKEG